MEKKQETLKIIFGWFEETKKKTKFISVIRQMKSKRRHKNVRVLFKKEYLYFLPFPSTDIFSSFNDCFFSIGHWFSSYRTYQNCNIAFIGWVNDAVHCKWWYGKVLKEDESTAKHWNVILICEAKIQENKRKREL